MTTKLLTQGVVGIVGVASSIGVAAAQHGGGDAGGMGGGMGGFGWWPLMWSLILLSVLVVVGYGVVSHGRRSANEHVHSDDDALSTLRTRYARGELSEEEFEERRRKLEDTR
jgi:putative membrane protein